MQRQENYTQARHACQLRSKRSSGLPRLPLGSGFATRLRRAVHDCILISEAHYHTRRYVRGIKALQHEKRAHYKSKYWFVIHPCSVFRLYWDTLMTFVYALTLIIDPTYYAYYPIFFKIRNLVWCHDVLSVIFPLDAVLMAFTGHYDSKTNNLVLDPWKIIWKNWIVITMHLIISFPLYQVTQMVTGTQDIARDYPRMQELSYYLAFLCVFRYNRFRLYVNDILMRFGVDTMKIQTIQAILMFIVAVHWITCFLLFIPLEQRLVIQNLVDHLDDSAANPRHLSEHSWTIAVYRTRNDPVLQYQMAFFETMATLCGAGVSWYNLPVDLAKIARIVLLCTGLSFKIYLIVIFLQILSLKRSSQFKYKDISDQLNEYMRKKQLPIDMQRKIISTFEYRHRKRYHNEDAILSTLSENLRQEVFFSTNKRILDGMSALRNLPITTLSLVLKRLEFEIYLPRDIIVKCGSQPEAMYFIYTGTVYVTTAAGREIEHLNDGNHFGDIELMPKFENHPRCVNVIADTICQVHRLDRRVFRELILPYASVIESLEICAINRRDMYLDA